MKDRRRRDWVAAMDRSPRVTIDLSPPLHAEAIASIAEEAGFTVVTNGVPLVDAAIVEDGSPQPPGVPLVILLGAGGRVRVEMDRETGFVFVDHPGEVVTLLQGLLGVRTEPSETPATGRFWRRRGRARRAPRSR